MKALFSSLCLVIVLSSSIVFAEGEVTYEDCTTVQNIFKYDGNDKYCEMTVQCNKCFSGIRLDCKFVKIPAFCRAGDACNTAKSCLDDNSFDPKIIDRLTHAPPSNATCLCEGKNGSGRGSTR